MDGMIFKMLLEKNKSYIAIFKMPSGEEFIGKVVEETVQHYLVSKPFTLVDVGRGIQWVPLLMMADHEQPVSIPKPAITAEPNPDIVSQYESAASGIALPSRSIIKTQ